MKMYIVKNEFADSVFGSHYPEPITEKELYRLAYEWGMNPEELQEQFTETEIDNNLFHMLVYLGLESVSEYMDPDIRESVHSDIAPCSEYDFLTEYIKRHFEKFGEHFQIN